MWRRIGDAERGEVAELLRRCEASEGWHLPLDAYQLSMDLAECVGGFLDGRLIAAASAGVGLTPTLDGVVDPRVRRRGIGAAMLDWALAGARGRPVTVRVRVRNPVTERLLTGRGLRWVSGELELSLAVPEHPVPVAAPPGCRLLSWPEADPADFHAAYQASYGEERPFERWFAGAIGEPEEAEEDNAAMLAVGPGREILGYAVLTKSRLWELGVIPTARRRGVGRALFSAALVRLQSITDDPYDKVRASVDVDNLPGRGLFDALGFEVTSASACYGRD
ncbi:hypothetical protein Lfu02_78830 [Longispora fulva]|nr:hypothetical protein Lfu02_78830 [Longispora fulva]